MARVARAVYLLLWTFWLVGMPDLQAFSRTTRPQLSVSRGKVPSQLNGDNNEQHALIAHIVSFRTRLRHAVGIPTSTVVGNDEFGKEAERQCLTTQ